MDQQAEAGGSSERCARDRLAAARCMNARLVVEAGAEEIVRRRVSDLELDARLGDVSSTRSALLKFPDSRGGRRRAPRPEAARRTAPA
jgi:hypothetical protein